MAAALHGKMSDYDQNLNQNANEIDHIKSATETMNHELNQLRQQLHEVQLSSEEKDAEISQLNLHMLSQAHERSEKQKKGTLDPGSGRLKSVKKSLSHKMLRRNSPSPNKNSSHKSSAKDIASRGMKLSSRSSLDEPYP